MASRILWSCEQRVGTELCTVCGITENTGRMGIGLQNSQGFFNQRQNIEHVFVGGFD